MTSREDLLWRAAEHAPLGVAIFDLDGEMRALNRYGRDLVRARLGSEAGAMEGRRWQESLPPLLETPFAGAFQELVEEEPGRFREYPHLQGSGGHWVRLERLGGDCIAVYFAHGDTVEEAGLELSRARAEAGGMLRDFRTLQESYPFGAIATFDEALRYRSVQGRVWSDLGIDPSTLIGRTFAQVWGPETAERLAEIAEVALRGWEAVQRIPFDGRIHEVWMGPLPAEEDGRRRGMLMSRDVTREVERSRRARLLEKAADAAAMGITVARCDGDQPLIYVSGGFERLTGYSTEECLGRNCRFLQGPSTDPFTVDAIREATRNEEGFQGVLLNYRKDGSSFWNRLTLTPFGPGNGEVTHYIGIQEDVTQVRETQREREHQRRLSELGTLAGSVAHDFNNMLMELQGRLALCEDEPVPEPVREELRGIREAVDGGAVLIRHLLAYSRRNAPLQPASSGGFLRRDVMIPVTRFLPRRVRLELDFPEQPIPIPLDVARLEQILLNLAKNASDAMPVGGTLRFAAEIDSAGGNAVLTVTDEGVGMPEELQERVFDAFFTTKGSSGTGLGLSSVKRIVEGAGGSVALESEEGVGTTVTVRLPLADHAAPGAPVGVSGVSGPRHRAQMDGLRALVVDDQPGIRSVLARLMEREGIRVVSAAEGVAALELYRASEEGFDLILADQDMPRMTGDVLLRSIAKEAESGASLPWMALMSGDLPDDPDLPEDVILIAKPFEVDELMGTLARRVTGRDA